MNDPPQPSNNGQKTPQLHSPMAHPTADGAQFPKKQSAGKATEYTKLTSPRAPPNRWRPQDLARAHRPTQVRPPIPHTHTTWFSYLQCATNCSPIFEHRPTFFRQFFGHPDLEWHAHDNFWGWPYWEMCAAHHSCHRTWETNDPRGPWPILAIADGDNGPGCGSMPGPNRGTTRNGEGWANLPNRRCTGPNWSGARSH